MGQGFSTLMGQRGEVYNYILMDDRVWLFWAGKAARINSIGETYNLLTYYMAEPPAGQTGVECIQCSICLLVSANPNDVANFYCGNCHFYHPQEHHWKALFGRMIEGMGHA